MSAVVAQTTRQRISWMGEPAGLLRLVAVTVRAALRTALQQVLWLAPDVLRSAVQTGRLAC